MCINQLLSSKLFTRHQIDIKNWLSNQFQSLSEPLHPLLLSIIEEYAIW